ncbi:MAG: hypothetical protein JO115_05740 [Pseudonocardiales bacterium]|nr:hypothetical protein [Pseudonocardiales bacterium]
MSQQPLTDAELDTLGALRRVGDPEGAVTELDGRYFYRSARLRLAPRSARPRGQRCEPRPTAGAAGDRRPCAPGGSLISGLITGVPRVSFEFYPALPYSEWPFVWYPLAGQRHAIDRQDRAVPLGSPMRTLCGSAHPRRTAGDTEWLWPTCQPCWDQACTILGIPPHR